jgi:hypothetical protein
MVVKQAEDEITAAQIVSGAMYMGTRALTATSGVGFDLMSETLSLNAMIENPTVFVLAQRPGPATGLPTWTRAICSRRRRLLRRFRIASPAAYSINAKTSPTSITG